MTTKKTRTLRPDWRAGFLALGAMALLTQAAQAQFFWGSGPRYSPDDIARSIIQQGFRPLTRPTRNDDVYVADVVDRRGRRERLIVSAESGEILQRFFMDDSRSFRRFADPSIPQGGPRPPARIPNEQPDQPSLFSRLFGGGGRDEPKSAPLQPDQELPLPTPTPKPAHKRPRPNTVKTAPVESVPLGPANGQPTSPPATASAPAAPGAQAPTAPATAAPAKPARSIVTDPLAIPGNRNTDPEPKPAATASSSKPTTAAPKPTSPANPDVPVAPLE